MRRMEKTRRRRSHLIAVVGCALTAMAWAACSNDVELPSSYHESHLGRPTNVEAVANDGVVHVTWQLASSQNAAGFVVRFTDASGVTSTRPAPDGSTRMLDVDDLSLSSGDLYLVEVWVVDALDSTAFAGPVSQADSLLIE